MSLDTRGIDPQRLLPQSLEDRLLGWLSRLGGLVLLAGVAVLWLSLVTWSLTDPSLTHATATAPRNLLGPLGAIVSDLMLQTLGFAAVFGLLAPLVWCLGLIRERRLDGGRVKLGFYPLSVLALAGALAAFPTLASWPLHHGFGGALGDGLFKLTSKLFAILNDERADLAAGLLLNATAFGMFAKSTGFDIDAAAKAFSAKIKTSAEARRAARDADAGSEDVQSERALWWDRSRKTSSYGASANAYGAAAGLAVPPDVNPPAHQWTADARYPHLHTYMQQPGAPLAATAGPRVVSPPQYAERAFAGDFRAVEFETHGTPFGSLSIDGPARPGDPPQHRGRSFDVNTDATSRAIAARFAPGHQEPAGPVAQAKAALAGKAAGMLGGIPLRNAEPGWKRPSLNLLKRAAAAKPGPEFTQTVMRGNARLLEDVLNDFGVKGEVKDIRPGPVVTLYELEPSRGTKSARVIGLADDIARSMSVASVRAAVVPGRNAIGLELPNIRREPVLLREMFESDAYKNSDAALPIALGKAIGGEPVVVDLARMPHLLVAGTTGSGKSVGINAFVLSLLFRHAPEDCRLLMIDPKMLELSVYNGIPHLLTPVVTDPAKAVVALNWAVTEMEERYKRMASLSVRNIDVFNNRVRNAKKRGEMLSRTVQTGFDKAGQAVYEKQKFELEPLPHIVIVVDEFADLMSVAGKDVEGVVQRLAQMARAAGIHLIMATQRPSVDIITGTIKANFPTRISFKVTSKIDSRTILNEQGAEQLLGQGDMLYSTGAGQIMRVHGAFVSDEEVEAIAQSLRRQGTPKYVDGILDAPQTAEIASGEREPTEADLYDRAVAIVLRDRKASTSYLQRRLSIGYNRAADLIERMEREGLISPANAVGKRDILVAGGGTADAA